MRFFLRAGGRTSGRVWGSSWGLWGPKNVSTDRNTGSPKAAKASIRRRSNTWNGRLLRMMALLLQPWRRRVPELGVEVGEDEEEDRHEGEEDHASWGRVCGWRVTNLRRRTAACKTLTSPAWEERNRWCPTGNVTAPNVCSFLESFPRPRTSNSTCPRQFVETQTLCFGAALSVRRIHYVPFAEFYMWDFPYRPKAGYASWKVTIQLIFVTQF